MRIFLGRDAIEWGTSHVGEKLRTRAELPGASAFDDAAHALASARAKGVSARELLPLACASSWLVNNAVPSPIFKRWLAAPLRDVWSEFVAAFDGAWAWGTFADEDRAALASAAGLLGIEGHGAGAISKVLALLAPHAVPLMPDAALWFAIDAAPRPDKPDQQSASASAIGTMLDWFTREGQRLEARLGDEAASFAKARPEAHLSPAQVLDRVLWFDSVGHRHFRTKDGAGWYAVKDDARQAVIKLAMPVDAALGSAPLLDLADPRCEALRDTARRMLDEAWA